MLRRGMVNYRPVYQEKSAENAVEAWLADPWLLDARSTAAKARARELMLANPAVITGLPNPKPAEKPAAGRLQEIHKGTLIVVGASDIPDVHAQAGALENGIRRARRIVIPAAGHLVHLEQPEAFNRAVLELLRPADAAAAFLATYQGDRTFAESGALFSYDASAPLAVQTAGTEDRGGVQVVDLSYASPLGGRVPAFLVLPPSSLTGQHPAAVFLHPGQGDRSTFVDEAVGLARRGLVGLMVGAPFTRPENKARGKSVFEPESARRDQLQTIVDLRRAFDLLAARPDVDVKRLAYVGHSLGATVGGTLAGVERRPVAFVLMAGLPAYSRSYSQGHNLPALAFQELLKPEQQQAFLKALDPLDAVHWVGHAAPARLLFQFAHRDEFISSVDAAAYLQAASEPKEARWYDTDHFFDDAARQDRDAWLAQVLGLN
jgi:pimeloyl-ACP methyl ester carboxylesterase